jgi:hypothetical protein
LRANGSATSAADTASALIDFLHNPLQTDPKLNYIDPDFPTSTESLTNINLSVNGQASGSRQDQTNTKKRIDSEPGARYPLIDVVDCDETNEVFVEDSAFETERQAEYMNVGPTLKQCLLPMLQNHLPSTGQCFDRYAAHVRSLLSD